MEGQQGGRDGWPILIWTPPQAVVRPIWVGVPTTLCQPTTPLHLIAIAVGDLPFRFSATFGPSRPSLSLPLVQAERHRTLSSRYIASYNSSRRFFHVGLRCRDLVVIIIVTSRSDPPIFARYAIAIPYRSKDRNWFRMRLACVEAQVWFTSFEIFRMVNHIQRGQ